MPINYNKLFILMKEKGIKKIHLRKNGFNANTVNRFTKNKSVSIETISKLCELLDCQPGDILEYTPDTNEEN